MEADTAALGLLAVGYPVSIVVISRFVPVVRERRTAWLVAHHAGVAAIIIGWAVRRPAAVAPNAIWLMASTVWYVWRPAWPGPPRSAGPTRSGPGGSGSGVRRSSLPPGGGERRKRPSRSGPSRPR